MAAPEISFVSSPEQEKNTVTTKHYSQLHPTQQQHCVSWLNIILSALVPLMIAIGTIVITFQQQNLDDLRRQQDRELANLTRMQDLQIEENRRQRELEIAERRYKQDRELANLTRMQDLQLEENRRQQELEIEERRYKQDRELANLTRMQDLQIEENRRQQELEIEERRYQQDRHQQNNLYYQNIYKIYIEDISNVLFRTNQSFADNEMKIKYIRGKTLMALRELNSERKTHIFLFLYENNLLPRIPLSSNGNKTNVSVDLSHSDLANISIKSTMASKYTFKQLSLVSVDLTNASFVECDFINGVHFSGLAMDNTNFFGSKFVGETCYPNNLGSLEKMHVHFNHVTLKAADFRSSFLCNVSFNGTNLAYANFSGAIFSGKLEFTGTNLAHVDFRNSNNHISFSMNVRNTNMTGVQWSTYLISKMLEGSIDLANVILPNGTWSILQTNLILNGNAEQNCSTFLNKTNARFPNWGKYVEIDYPTLAHSQNSSKCYFNLTVLKNVVGMRQFIDISNLSVFIDSGEASFSLTTTIACTNGTLSVWWAYETAEGSEVSSASTNLKSEQLNWIIRGFTPISSIPVNTRRLRVAVRRNDKGTCYVDDITLHIIRKEGQ